VSLVEFALAGSFESDDVAALRVAVSDCADGLSFADFGDIEQKLFDLKLGSKLWTKILASETLQRG
jgi:hypothetical protein